MNRRLIIGAFCVVAIARGVSSSCDKDLPADMTFAFSGRNLNWPCAGTRNIYETNGRYVPRNMIVTRFVMHKDEVIVAQPRFKPGVPFSLGVASLKNKCNAPITPFPCWSMQEEGNCAAIQSAVDLYIDGQEIIWVLDAGIVNTLDAQPIRRCPPKVVGIDARSGKVVKVIELGNLVSTASRLQYLVVDLADDGRVFIYISDAAARSLVVYDVLANRGYRVVLPKALTLGCPRRDVLYIALVRKNSGVSVLHLTYLGSSHMYSIKTQHLRKGSTNGAVVDVGSKTSRIVILGTDHRTSIFLRNKGESNIYMWDTETCFKSDNFILVQKGGDCRLATAVAPGYKNFMWALESNFQDYIQNTVGCSGASVVLHPLVKSCDQ